jgi:succinate dehydrogenase/fumarate reductase flavoprotein subunit
MLQDYLAINRWRVEPGLARIYCEHAPDVVEWLVELGLPFGPIVRAGAERVPRGTARSARARRSSTCWSGRVVRAASSSRSGIGSTICS